MRRFAPKPFTIQRRHCNRRAGQALVEMALVSLLLTMFLFGLIDFGRAIMAQQVLVNLSREAANLASRGTTFTDTLDAIVASSGSLDIEENGYVILTEVTKDANGSITITQQQARGNQPSSSRVGTLCGPASLPNNAIPAPGRKLVVAEVFVQYAPITPVGQVASIAMPSTLYDVAYF